MDKIDMIERPTYNDSEESNLRSYINYLRNNTKEIITDIERKHHTEECKRAGVEGFLIENYVNMQINYHLSQKDFFDSMSEELVEKYIKQEMNRKKLLKYEIGQKDKKIYQAIENVRYLTEQEYSLKSHIKNQLKNLIKDEDSLILLGASSLGLYMGTEILVTIMETNNYRTIPSQITILSITLASIATIYGYQQIKQWFEMKKNNPEDIERLKKAGIYDLLIDAVESKRAYEELYQEEHEKRRR